MRIHDLGDSALVLLYEDAADGDVIPSVQMDYHKLRINRLTGIRDIVPCYNSIGVYYNPDLLDKREVEIYIETSLSTAVKLPVQQHEVITIPVYYGGDGGSGLYYAAETLNLQPGEVIALHSGITYTVWGIGFLPGFPYMGRLDSRLAIPRKPVPTAGVPAGSVAIAGFQTGIYPLECPGGWHVIGWTPLKMFDLSREDICLLKTGDRVRFEPVLPED